MVSPHRYILICIHIDGLPSVLQLARHSLFPAEPLLHANHRNFRILRGVLPDHLHSAVAQDPSLFVQDLEGNAAIDVFQQSLWSDLQRDGHVGEIERQVSWKDVTIQNTYIDGFIADHDIHIDSAVGLEGSGPEVGGHDRAVASTTGALGGIADVAVLVPQHGAIRLGDRQDVQRGIQWFHSGGGSFASADVTRQGWSHDQDIRSLKLLRNLKEANR